MLSPNVASVMHCVALICIGVLVISPSCTIEARSNCESTCGEIALNYPFGEGWNCGNPAFQSYVNCSHGKLQFYTPTGTYKVQSIDYRNNVMIVVDPLMSTCTSMQLSGAFGLPIGAPFSIANYDKVVLIGCSSTSSLYSKQSCDTSQEGQEICQSLYNNCEGISEIGIVANSVKNNSNINNNDDGASSSCCVYANSLLQTPPYEIDLPLLQCSTYTSVYHIGGLQNPKSSWLFGIALQFYPNSQSQPSSGKNPNCHVCQEAQDNHGYLGAAPLSIQWTAGLIMLAAAVTLVV